METVIWCGKYWLNNCATHYIEPVFGANGSKKAEKNTSQLQKQNDKKAFGDLLQEAVKKYNL